MPAPVSLLDSEHSVSFTVHSLLGHQLQGDSLVGLWLAVVMVTWWNNIVVRRYVTDYIVSFTNMTAYMNRIKILYLYFFCITA